jgi:hypothetical protein
LRGFGKDRSKENESISEQEQWEWIWSTIRGISEQRITADTNKERLQYGDEIKSWEISSIEKRIQNNRKINGLECFRNTSNSDRKLPQRGSGKDRPYPTIGYTGSFFCGNIWENFPTQSPVCRGNDGFPYRMDRLKALGNSIVPQVAYEIFKVINKIELFN